VSNIENLVILFNQIRSQGEGNVDMTRQLATDAGLPTEVVDYIALTQNWRGHAEQLRQRCRENADNQSLDVFWRAAALESLGAINPQDTTEQQQERLAYLDKAEALVAELPEEDKRRRYIKVCCAAGRCETTGQPKPSLDTLLELATIMVEDGLYNAGGRVKTFLDVVTQAIKELVRKFAAKEASGDHGFSTRQIGFLKGAHGNLFPTA
jgi:hypothetical protein